MKRLVLIILVCLVMTTPASSDMVKPTGSGSDYPGAGYGPWQASVGDVHAGEFSILPDGWSWDPLVYYDDYTKDEGTEGTFQTFCMELGEYLYPETWHDSVLNLNGIVITGNETGGDPISVGTAWLYSQFATGVLTGYDYENDDSLDGRGRKNSAFALQQTLWWLEGEGSDPTNTNIFRQAVVTEFSTITGAMEDNEGLYPVAVLNLYELGYAGDMDHLRQDVLVMVPVPAAVLLGILGLGAVGVKLRKYA